MRGGNTSRPREIKEPACVRFTPLAAATCEKRNILAPEGHVEEVFKSLPLTTNRLQLRHTDSDPPTATRSSVATLPSFLLLHHHHRRHLLPLLLLSLPEQPVTTGIAPSRSSRSPGYPSTQPPLPRLGSDTMRCVSRRLGATRRVQAASRSPIGGSPASLVIHTLSAGVCVARCAAITERTSKGMVGASHTRRRSARYGASGGQVV